MKINFYSVDMDNRCLINKVLKRALKAVGQLKNVELSVSFVSPEEIKETNRLHRQTDSVTDVLSFPYLQLLPLQKIDDTFKTDVNPQTGNFMLGEILICPQRAKEQAESFGHSTKREIAFLALHGFLHLCGFDHVDAKGEKQMKETAEAVLQALRIVR